MNRLVLLLLVIAVAAGGTYLLKQRQTNPPNPPTISASLYVSPSPTPSPPADGPSPTSSPVVSPKTVYPSPTPKLTPSPKPTPTVTPSVPVPPVTGTTRQIKTWLLSYYPVGNYLSVIGDPAVWTKNVLFPALNETSKYHGYKNQQAIASLSYILADEDIKVENNPPPISGTRGISGSYDYGQLFSKYDLCNLAKQKDIKAVILWSDGTQEYAGGMWESAITGNKGIPTNGTILPYCPDKTIVVYGLNYTRGLAEAMESYGHHLEAVFRRFRPEWYSWSGENQPQNPGLWGRGESCGNVHNPPNARNEYDRDNTASFLSDCRNWQPGGGVGETLTCSVWGCTTHGYLKWWMQNMPGLGNNKVPNWWVYIADPDNCYQNPLNC